MHDSPLVLGAHDAYGPNLTSGGAAATPSAYPNSSTSASASAIPTPMATEGTSTNTLYVPIASPPTPAPSPRLSISATVNSMFNPESLSSLSPLSSSSSSISASPFSIFDPAHHSRREFANLLTLGSSTRQQYLISLLHECTPSELLFISTTIAPLLKRDFLKELPTELALYILCFVDHPKTLTRAGRVSRYWRTLVGDEWIWKRMCVFYQFDQAKGMSAGYHQARYGYGYDSGYEYEDELSLAGMMKTNHQRRRSRKSSIYSTPHNKFFSYREHFKYSYRTMLNWRQKGLLLHSHRVPVLNPDSAVITSVALDAEWVVVGLANCRIHVFSAKTGVLSRTLVGHEQGVWA